MFRFRDAVPWTVTLTSGGSFTQVVGTFFFFFDNTSGWYLALAEWLLACATPANLTSSRKDNTVRKANARESVVIEPCRRGPWGTTARARDRSAAARVEECANGKWGPSTPLVGGPQRPDHLTRSALWRFFGPLLSACGLDQQPV